MFEAMPTVRLTARRRWRHPRRRIPYGVKHCARPKPRNLFCSQNAIRFALARYLYNANSALRRSTLSEQGIVLGPLRNTREPRLVP